MCVAAAFQGSYELAFRHDNIVGWHTVDGVLERGKPQDDLGAFTWSEGQARIWDVDDAESAIKAASEHGGDGYQQFVVLYGGERGAMKPASSAATGCWPFSHNWLVFKKVAE